ncbi:hypothetical protein P3T76_004356 [Phytophthora citrophthora]|uniref:Uncharacterized protein n=1 Tax=Phytophthora citrophthora TaxID=4793 RepID=A0AAD9GST6_9STRA|nr:hypothetical protein P3T76_004356 [Phytophthora citrophthora]
MAVGQGLVRHLNGDIYAAGLIALASTAGRDNLCDLYRASMSWPAEQGMRKLGIRTSAAIELRPVRRHDGSYTGGSSAVETTSTIEVGFSTVIDE